MTLIPTLVGTPAPHLNLKPGAVAVPALSSHVRPALVLAERESRELLDAALKNGTRLVIEVKNGFNPEALLEELSLREAAVIRLRYGLEDDTPQTLAQIGEGLQLSRERVRQIEQGAFAKRRELTAHAS